MVACTILAPPLGTSTAVVMGRCNFSLFFIRAFLGIDCVYLSVMLFLVFYKSTQIFLCGLGGVDSTCSSRNEAVGLCQTKQNLPGIFAAFSWAPQLLGCALDAPGFTIT